MEWTDILFLLVLFLVAGFIFYRAYRKKKWCPAVFGSGDNETPAKKTKIDSNNQ